MDKVILQVLVMAFAGVLGFMIANTSASFMFPIFDNMSASMPFMTGGVDYNTTSGIFKGAFFLAIFIVVAIPIAYLFIRLIRKEPVPREYNYPYYPGSGF